MKKLFLLFFSLAILQIGNAQTTISGTVSDENGDAIPGASVVELGTTNGTSTDFDGKFTLQVETGTSIIFSFIGYASKTLPAVDGMSVTLTESAEQLQEIQIVGSRNPNRTVTESPVAVDVIDINELIKTAPQINLNQIMTYVAPSFNANTQTISDGTDHIDPASLRGLGPDQVLVLINGKRRHTTSLINVNGTFGRGNVGTDLNAIPAAAIQRIEVLRDGAAAQYGSDAIAGVINIVLKNDRKLSVGVTGGGHVSKNSNMQTGGLDGETVNVSFNWGTGLGKEGGFINLTGDFDARSDYNRMKEWEGTIFNRYNSIEWAARKAGYDITKLEDNDISDLKQYAQQVDHFTAETKSLINTAPTLDSMRTLLAADATEAELTARGMQRSDFNMRVGQSKLLGYRFMGNFELPVGNYKIYAFGGLSRRNGNAAGFYRLPNQERTYTPQYINGFLPEINSIISDNSFSMGVKGKISEWNLDISNTYGSNSFMYRIGNTYNASTEAFGRGKTEFDAGGFAFLQNTTNVDLSRFFEDVLEGMNLAFGGEIRYEQYDIIAGEEQSYGQYTNDNTRIVSSTMQPSKDFFDRSRPGGSQVFPGFGPANALSKNRTSAAGYLDIELDVLPWWLFGAAMRYENYTDFGDAFTYKLTSLFKVAKGFNLRAAFNTGFRAPSLHQQYFNSTSTIFDNQGNPQEVGTFRNDSRAASLLGIPKMKDERSNSISGGFTLDFPTSGLSITADGFLINISDRIVYTGQFSADASKAAEKPLADILTSANASRAAFFVNAIDTRTWGTETVITHTLKFGNNNRLKTDLALTYIKTQRVGDIKSSQLLKDAGKESTYFGEEGKIYLESAVPNFKSNLTFNLALSKFNIFLRNTFFGQTIEATGTVENQQKFKPKVLTDISFGYTFFESLSVSIGSNNLLDIEMDRAVEGNRSGGRFDWTRRSPQFGIGGRYLYLRLNYTL